MALHSFGLNKAMNKPTYPQYSMASTLSTPGKRVPVTSPQTLSNTPNRSNSSPVNRTLQPVVLARGGSEIPPLGSTTNIAAKRGENSPKNAEKAGLKKQPTPARERRFNKVDGAKNILPNTARIQVCMAMKPGAVTADVMVDREADKGHFRGIMCCGDIWACAVCAERITAVRRDELRHALDLAAAKGWSVGLLTLTAAHYTNTDLVNHLDAFLLAIRRFMGDGSVKRLKEEYGWVGYVRSLEYTYNVNGANPHSHAVVFFDRALTAGNVAGLEIALAKAWRRVCQRRGLNASIQHGLKLSNAQSEIKDYIAKHGAETSSWDAADEMTRHMHKQGPKDLKGRQKGFTAWELLELAMCDDDDELFLNEAALIRSPRRAGKLFQQYYAAFSGKNQLVWSPGLRDLLGMAEEISDAEIADTDLDKGQNWELALSLERSAYNRVKAAGKLAEVLNLCIADRMDDVRALLRRLGVSHVDLTQYDMRPPPR